VARVQEFLVGDGFGEVGVCGELGDTLAVFFVVLKALADEED